MQLHSNISYFFKTKRNDLLPEIISDFVLNTEYQLCSFLDVAEYRNVLLYDKTILNICDFGTGKNRSSKVKTIVKKSATSSIHGGVLQKLVYSFNVQNALELGTSLGIGTMYLAKASKHIKVTTIEAAEEIFNFTKNEFSARNIENVEFINKDIDSVFDNDILKNKKFDLFYIDGNHTYEATINYYNYIKNNLCNKKAIIILDDINWSCGMFRAWKKIKKEENNSLLVNLYQIGIIFVGYNMRVGEIHADFIREYF